MALAWANDDVGAATATALLHISRVACASHPAGPTGLHVVLGRPHPRPDPHRTTRPVPS